ncbi:MAG: SH3 domain-containing protein [Desulfobacterales bacterium]|jgi:SH3-like domain-containing protein|nr:SH3 domain-containing protein [Desulfobacterales bacterium]
MKYLPGSCVFVMLLVTATIFFSFSCTTTQSTQPAGTTEIEKSAPATTEIVLGLVNLRQRPSMNSMIIKVLKKGTELAVLEEEAGWLYVELEAGMRGWVAKSTTSMGTRQESP